MEPPSSIRSTRQNRAAPLRLRYKRLKPVIVDPWFYLVEKKDVFFASHKRELPLAFKLFSSPHRSLANLSPPPLHDGYPLDDEQADPLDDDNETVGEGARGRFGRGGGVAGNYGRGRGWTSARANVAQIQHDIVGSANAAQVQPMAASVAIKSFFVKGFLPKGMNSTILALIPKKKEAKEIKDYRPISCCNVIYKPPFIPTWLKTIQRLDLKIHPIEDRLCSLAKEAREELKIQPHRPSIAGPKLMTAAKTLLAVLDLSFGVYYSN